MTSTQFITENLDLTAYLICLGFHMNILRPEYGTRALFQFKECANLLAGIVGFERGDGGAKKLLSTRGRLYREASAIMRGAK